MFKCTMTGTRRPGATLDLPVSCVGTGAYWGQRGMQPAVTSAASHMVSLFSDEVYFPMYRLLPAAQFSMQLVRSAPQGSTGETSHPTRLAHPHPCNRNRPLIGST